MLYDNKATREKITLAFRMVETLGKNDIIIGLQDIRKHDLTSVFKHIYQQKERTNVFRNDTNDIGDRQVPIINLSQSSSQGTDAEVIDANETFLRLKEAQRKALNDPAAFSTRVDTSRRVLRTPRLQRQVITRGGKRSDIPRLPSHRSNRLRSNGFSCQPKEEWLTSNGKSLNDILELHANELIEGHIYPKTEFLDVEDDNDYIDNFIDETPYDKMMTDTMNNKHDKNEDTPSSSSIDRCSVKCYIHFTHQ